MRHLVDGLALAALFVTGSLSHADDWPQFRGPTGDGHSEAMGLPVEFDRPDSVVWKTHIPGTGYSSPVVRGDRVWVTSAVVAEPPPQEAKARLADIPQGRSLQVADSVDLHVVCLDRETGHLNYDTTLIHLDAPKPIQNFNSYASPTPVIDGDRLYCDFGAYGTACLDTKSGGELWTRRLEIEHFVGPGSSPFICDNMLILVRDGGYQQFVTALDKLTGETVWRTSRPPIEASSPQLRKAFCTPFLISHSGRRQLIIPGAQWVVAYDPSTGKEIWRVSYGSGYSNVPRPIYRAGIVYICTGFSRAELWAIRVDGQGDVTDTHVAWKETRQIPKRSSPILVGDKIYVVSDNGIASCLAATSGETIWRERLGGDYSASPIYADKKIYFFSETGTISVLKPGTEFTRLAQSTIEGHLMATPAAVGNGFILRTDTHVLRCK